MKIFINYADKKFYNSQMYACETAKVYGFDWVVPCRKENIDLDFLINNQNILSQERGAGYWLWKPYFILDILKQSSNGDYLFYCDSGAYLINDINYLIDALNASGQDMMSFDLQEQVERKWTKRDVFVYNNCDTSEFTDTNICDAAFQLIKKSEFTVNFYTEYLKQSCMENLITDSPNIYGLPNYPEFLDHRHDQSIYSIQVKKHKLIRFRTPSQFGLGYESLYEHSTYPQIINHHRNSS